MGSDVWSGIMGIAMALIGLAFFTLIIGRSGQTAQVVSSAGQTFGNLLSVVTLQNGGYGSMLSGGFYNGNGLIS
jgi:hypothetical protein